MSFELKKLIEKLSLNLLDDRRREVAKIFAENILFLMLASTFFYVLERETDLLNEVKDERKIQTIPKQFLEYPEFQPKISLGIWHEKNLKLRSVKCMKFH